MSNAPGSPKMEKIFRARRAYATAGDRAGPIDNLKSAIPLPQATSALFFAKNRFSYQHPARDKRLHASRGCAGDAFGACGQPPSRPPGLYKARLVRLAGKP